MTSSGATYDAQLESHPSSKRSFWKLGTYTRSGSDRKAKWKSSDEGDGTLPKLISLNCSYGRIHAWRGEAPSYEVSSAAVANKARQEDLLAFVSRARIPKNAGMGTYGLVKEAELSVHPRLMHDASADELALFLGILTDFFWSRGREDVVEPPLPPQSGMP